jgi:hypothetical protein
MLTEYNREYLIEMLAEHETYEADYEGYVEWYDIHRDSAIEEGDLDALEAYPHPDTMCSMDFENFYYDDMYALFSCREDAELIEMAIESGCIASLEDFLKEEEE